LILKGRYLCVISSEFYYPQHFFWVLLVRDWLDIILERAFREYTQEEKTQMAARKNESYVHLLDQMSPADLSVEVKDTLDELRKRGYKLAIGSSSKNTKKILKQIGLGDYFDAISDGTNITKSKPDPEVFLKAAEMLGEKLWMYLRQASTILSG
jgi:HAD superfamily hydrolase (TIGR01549 family)